MGRYVDTLHVSPSQPNVNSRALVMLWQQCIYVVFVTKDERKAGGAILGSIHKPCLLPRYLLNKQMHHKSLVDPQDVIRRFIR